MKSKKLKFGSLAIALTVVFIAVIVLINALVTAFNKNRALDIDMTSDSLFTITDASKKLLDKNETPVKVYFLQERDAVSEDSNSEGMMLNLVDSYANEYDWIDVQYIDLQKRPKFKEKYTTGQSDTLAKTSVIVECEKTGEYKVLKAEDYFLLETKTEYIYSYQTAVGFQGELALTSAILNVLTPDGLKAVFETGHGEIASEPLRSFLNEVGYVVSDVDISENSVDDDVSLMIINRPTKDFVGTIDGTEIQSDISKLTKFINKPGNNMIVFMSPDTSKLEQFEEFLAVYGVSMQRYVLSDNKSSAANTNGQGIYGTYNATDDTVGSEIIGRIDDKDYKPVFLKAAPIDILFTHKNDIMVSPVVTTTKSATYTDESGDNSESGQYNIMTVSTKFTQEGESNLILCSTTYYNSFLLESKYGNRELFYSVAEQFGAVNITPDIKIKAFEDTTLNITENQSRAWGIVITTVPAAIVLVIGLIVWNKRRHL